MTATKKFFLAYSKATNAALHLMKNTGESVTDLLDLNDEESVSSAKEQIEQGSVDAIILVMNKNILTVTSLATVLKTALEKDVSVVLIHPDGAALPTSASISSLDSSIQKVFRQTPIAFIPDYSKHCWKKIFERINRTKQEPPKVNWFICGNPKNSIGLTLSKELTELGDSTFVNYKDDFDASYCRKSIESADYFVLVITKELFASSNCRKELIWAIRHNKPIAIIKDKAFKLKESIPTEWRDFASLLNGPATLVYTPFYASECAIELFGLGKQQQQKKIITPDSKNYPVAKKQWKNLDALDKNPTSTAYSDLARNMHDNETIELDDGQVMTKRHLSLHALKLDSNNSYAFCTLGDTLRSDDTYELPDGTQLDKRGCFLKAIELDANNELAYCDLADSLSETETVQVNGEDKTAIDLYLISIKINPNFATAYNNLACQMPKKTTVTLLDGEVVSDKELFLRSLKSDSSDPLVFQNLGVALSKGEKVTLPDGRVVSKKELQEWK